MTVSSDYLESGEVVERRVGICKQLLLLHEKAPALHLEGGAFPGEGRVVGADLWCALEIEGFTSGTGMFQFVLLHCALLQFMLLSTNWACHGVLAAIGVAVELLTSETAAWDGPQGLDMVTVELRV